MAVRFEKIVIVTRRTELEDLVLRFNTVAQARFYLEQSGHSFAAIQTAHDRYHAALRAVTDALPDEPRHQVIERELVPRFAFDERDLVITVGQDGLVSNTAKYLAGQPIVAINPDPARFDGPLLPFGVRDLATSLPAILHGDFSASPITLAVASSSNNQTLLAFNDFFIGARTHVSARYEIETAGTREVQSSSGVIVSTGAGSTGWLRSVYAGAVGVMQAMGRDVAPLDPPAALPWDTQHLIYSVREPFPSRMTQTALVHGRLSREQPLILTSNMPTNGVIFSDGVEADYLDFNAGTTLTIAPSERTATLVSR